MAVPPGVFTATLCGAPATPARVMAVIDVSDTTAKLSTATTPTVTLVAPVKLVPVIVIVVPPTVEPLAGLTEMIVGGGGVTKVKALV